MEGVGDLGEIKPRLEGGDFILRREFPVATTKFIFQEKNH